VVIGSLRYARERVTCLYEVEFACLRRISDARNIEEHPGLNDIGVVANPALIRQVDSRPVGLGAVVIGPLRYARERVTRLYLVVTISRNLSLLCHMHLLVELFNSRVLGEEGTKRHASFPTQVYTLFSSFTSVIFISTLAIDGSVVMRFYCFAQSCGLTDNLADL